LPTNDYFIATDLEALRMESELLGLENAYLKGRITSLEEELRTARQTEDSLRRELEQVRNARQTAEHS
jgi:FtsZ-binding cell division protein ZapB